MSFNKKFLLAGVALAGVITAGAFFATQSQAAQDDLDIEAVIIEPIDITCNTVLSFGNLDAGAGGGTAVISTAGALSTTGDVGDYGGTQQAGVCTVTGQGALAFDVTIADTTVVHTVTPADTMDVDTFTVDDGTGAAGVPYAANLVGGTVDIDIGATLTVAGGQEPGTYEGTATVDVVYQ